MASSLRQPRKVSAVAVAVLVWFELPSRSGEIHELQQELNQATEELRKDAVKKVLRPEPAQLDVLVAGDCGHDCRQRRLGALPRCRQVYAGLHLSVRCRTALTRCCPPQTNNVELKKLVYLYIINYAKTQPELAILAVNTFVKVCQRSP